MTTLPFNICTIAIARNLVFDVSVNPGMREDFHSLILIIKASSTPIFQEVSVIRETWRRS